MGHWVDLEWFWKNGLAKKGESSINSSGIVRGAHIVLNVND